MTIGERLTFLFERAVFYMVRILCTMRGHYEHYDPPEYTQCFFCGKNTQPNEARISGPMSQAEREAQESIHNSKLPGPGVELERVDIE